MKISACSCLLTRLLPGICMLAGGREMPAAFYDDAGVGPANVPVRENLGTDNPL